MHDKYVNKLAEEQRLCVESKFIAILFKGMHTFSLIERKKKTPTFDRRNEAGSKT